MTVRLEVRDRIDTRGWATIPKSVHHVLGTNYGAEIAQVVGEDGVRVASADDEADPVVESFIEFLARDMQQNPRESIVEFPAALVEHMIALTRGAVIDLNEKIDAPVAL